MARYIDSFIIPVPKKNLKVYENLAKLAAKTWIRHGAIEYVEAIAEDVSKGEVTSFPRSVKLKSSEVVVFGYAVYKSRAHRDRVLTKVMKDEKLLALWHSEIFDGMRMIWGGFKTCASAKSK